MSLSQAIDALLAHVPDDGIIPYSSERRRQFDVLDRAVWIEACKLSLEEKLPPEEPERPSLGLTHLPGGGYVNGDFAPTGLRWWRNHLLALRALAETKTAPQAGIEEQMERIVLAVGDVNAAKIMAIAQRQDWSGERKMKEILMLDNRFAGKDSVEWASLLGVKPAAVRGYSIWKMIQQGKGSAD